MLEPFSHKIPFKELENIFNGYKLNIEIQQMGCVVRVIKKGGNLESFLVVAPFTSWELRTQFGVTLSNSSSESGFCVT